MNRFNNHTTRFQPQHFGSLQRSSTSNRSSRQQLLVSNCDSITKENLRETLRRLMDERDVEIKSYESEKSFLITLGQSHDAYRIQSKLVEAFKQNPEFQQVSVEIYEPKDERNVYVKNLPLNYTEEELKTYFAEFGEIISVKIIQKEANNNSIAFVRYKDKSDAQKAITEMNKKNLSLIGRDRKVHCELSKISNSSVLHDRSINFSSTPVPHQTVQYSEVPYQNVFYQVPVYDQQLQQAMANISISNSQQYYPYFPNQCYFNPSYQPGPNYGSGYYVYLQPQSGTYLVNPPNQQNQNPQ